MSRSSSASSPSPSRKKALPRSRPRSRAPPATAATADRGRPAAAPKASGRRKGAKRDAGELEALTTKLATCIKRHPGQRIEQIDQELGIATKELALPVKKLIAAKRLSTKGQKRATTYFAK